MLFAVLGTGCAHRQPVEFPPHVEPDIDGTTHVVKGGETLWRIARAYGVSVEDLAIANQIAEAEKLRPGQELFVPGAKAPLEVPPEDPEPRQEEGVRAVGKRPFVWPLNGVLYARFGKRGESRHDGIDIAAPNGTPVRAAGDGEVLYAGEQRGYGHVVVIQHAGGLVTLYAHNRENVVSEGARVKAGDVIARVGEASSTSGPHMHFEVREDGKPRDPLKYLPPPR